MASARGNPTWAILLHRARGSSPDALPEVLREGDVFMKPYGDGVLLVAPGRITSSADGEVGSPPTLIASPYSFPPPVMRTRSSGESVMPSSPAVVVILCPTRVAPPRRPHRGGCVVA